MGKVIIEIIDGKVDLKSEGVSNLELIGILRWSEAEILRKILEITNHKNYAKTHKSIL